VPWELTRVDFLGLGCALLICLANRQRGQE